MLSLSPDHLIAIFDSVAEKNPDLPAVRGNGFSCTYREFRDLTCRFARDLHHNGVGQGDFVGICLERSAEMLAGIFGILRSGAAYVPADPQAPSSRLQQLYADAGIRLVVTTKSLAGYLESLGFTTLVPDVSLSGPVEPVPFSPGPEQPAYILFTSGSTGKPKGVIVPHRAVVNLISYMQDEYPLQTGDTVLLKSPYTFDGSVWELFGWILMAGNLYVADPGEEKDPAKLLRTCSDERISFLFFVPAMLRTFLDYLSMSPDPSRIRSIKWVSVGGEVLPVPLADRFYKLFGSDKARLINVYGPTETTVYATTWLCDPIQDAQKIPVGFPVTNDKIYILNEEMTPVQQGEEGEICIGGAGVALGYLNDQPLTAVKFVEDPFRPGAKMYRTGDIGRQLPNGAFDFIGRRDFQVKLRGLRIELGEIEHALAKIGEIAEQIVIFSKDHHGDDALIAYIRPVTSSRENNNSGFYLAGDALTSHLRGELLKTLPQYMVPAFFVIAPDFQLTVNGKIDRTALPPVSSLISEETDNEFHPQNQSETKILGIWKEILGRRSIGSHETFFEAGGHSIKAIQLIIEIKRAFGTEIPLKTLYREMTLRKMSDLISDQIPVSPDTPPAESISAGVGTLHPITMVQEEMWILHSADPSGLIHNIQVEFFIGGDPDTDVFLKVLKETVLAEEMFNSAFPCPEGRPVRQITERRDFEIPVIDLSRLPDSDREKSYQNLAFQHGQIRFNLEKPPLFSFRMVIIAHGEMRLLFAVHHIVFDGWSLFLFMERLRNRFEGRETDIQAGNHGLFARHYNQYVKEQRWMPEMAFWKKRLKGIPDRLTLPARAAFDPHLSTLKGERHWWRLSADLSRKIDELSKSAGVTPFISLISAYQLTLGAFSGQSDVVVGTPYANRLDPEVAGLIGYYTNMVSIRGILHPDDSARSFLKRCNDETIEAFSNAAVPFGEIAREIVGGVKLGINPVFHAIFVLQNWPHIDPHYPGFTLRQREIGNNTSKTDIMLNVEKSDEQYVCWLEYDTNLFDSSMISRIADSMTSLLNAMQDAPDQPLQPLITASVAAKQTTDDQTCIIIGNGALALQCTNLLRGSGFRISAIISGERSLREYAETYGISLYDHPRYCNELPETDHIFSINNGFILKKNFTSLARGMVINYHDAPLPTYAGMFATHWALLHGEKEHGVSWHLVTEEIDGGDILASQKVPVFQYDTAETLNVRCFEAALHSFSNLLPAIREDRLTPIRQDPSRRTYFGLATRPRHFGCISGMFTAEEMAILLRATHCGNHLENEFLLPFFLIDKKIFFVQQAEVLNDPVKGEAGSITETDGRRVIVIRNGALAPVEIFDHHGKKCNPDQILQPGGFIRSLPEHTFDRIVEIFRKIAHHEPFWKETLENAGFIYWPVSQEARPDKSVTLKLPALLSARIKSIFPDAPPENTLTALLTLFLMNLTGQTEGSFGFSGSRLSEEIRGAETVFSPWVPLNVRIDPQITARENIVNIFRMIERAAKAVTFTRSLMTRAPLLREKERSHPDFILFSGNLSDAVLSDGLSAIGFCDDELRIVAPDNAFVYGAGSVSEGFLMFLENFAENPDKKITETELISSACWQDLQQKIHRHTEPDWIIGDVVSQFIHISEKYPDKTAVFDHGKAYDYQRLANDIGNLSARLSEHGISPGQKVAIVARREYEYFVSVMSTLYCGACFIPIDPEWPDNRRTLICRDADVSLVITTGSEECQDFSVLHVTGDTPPGDGILFKAAEVRPEAPAYIIYTSGTTGLPKGVIISRSALATFITGALSLYQTGSEDRILQFCNLAFDASVEEIFMAFCTGAALCLRDEEMLRPEKLIDFSIQNQITVWDLPTAFWRQAVVSDDYKLLSGSRLKLVIIGGEAVLPGDIAHWESGHPTHRLVNTYGPTETTVVAIAHEIKPGTSGRSVPIGRPLQGYTLFVVNRSFKILPQGITGELLIAGNGVASGYVNRKKEENEAFIHFFPPDSNDSVLCYRTGDLVTVGNDGLIFYSGRNDGQVKIRGYRIEPLEIEQQISCIEDVESCVVAADKPDGRDYRLTAFVCGNGDDLTGKIREYLHRTVTPWMVPERIVAVKEIPLTFNGKADRQALLKLAFQEVNPPGSEASLPFTPDEILVYDLWKKILKINIFTIDDDFFELGGHSLKAVEFMSKIRKQRGVDISIASLIRNPTVRKFGALLSSGEHGKYWQCMVPIRTEGTKTPLFLIHGAGLNILLYQSLTRCLKPGRPIYALQAKGLDGKCAIRTRVDEMATDYITEIEAIRPEGPVMLLGFSLGGFTAFEIARKLNERGREVAFCGVIDAVTAMTKREDSPVRALNYKLSNLFLKCCFNAKLIARNLFKPGSNVIQSKIRSLRVVLEDKLIRFGLKKRREYKVEYINGKPQYLTNHARMLMWQGLKEFELIPADIRVDLFRAGIATFYIAEKEDYGWRGYAKKGVEIHTTPAEHSLLFAEPNDKIFAEILDKRLEEVEQQNSGACG